MNHSKIESHMKENYGRIAHDYRADDELDARGRDHQRICVILGDICGSFGRPIKVLEAGCGTGRYFHGLRQVKKLTGMDICEEMLDAARDPVQAEAVTVEETELICGSFYTAEFPTGSFDFIYLLGVFGNGCAMTPELCAKFHQWLSPDGCLYFDAFDITAKPLSFRVKRRLRKLIYTVLPRRWREAWDAKQQWLPFFFSSVPEIKLLFRSAGFADCLVESHGYELTTGAGKKLECFATKRSVASARPQTGLGGWENVPAVEASPAV